MKTAIITGASSGMGREFVKMTAQRGDIDEIWVVARRRDRLEALQQEVSVPLHVLPLDLLREESFAAFQSELESRRPNVTFLVNASGFGRFGRNDQIPLQDDLDMIDLNCKALVRITKLTLPYMPRGSRIVEVDSLSAFQPVPYIGMYGATKAFVLSYTRAINQELKPEGIRVMAVSPGWVKTEFFNHAFETNQGQVRYFNRLYEAKDVVATALKDLYRSKKDVSIHGLPVRAQVLMVKLLPHSLVMKVWQSQQKKEKNNTGLTTQS